MLICCLIPIAAVILLSFMDVKSTYLTLILILVCPIMMFVMVMTSRRNGKRNYY
jgi:ABC-type transport system involved in cytochrome bd biosynthesis fused ATPase/permease subunit